MHQVAGFSFEGGDRDGYIKDKITRKEISYICHNGFFDAIFGNKSRFMAFRGIRPDPPGNKLIFEIGINVFPWLNR